MNRGAEDNLCRVDNATTRTILKNQKFFSELVFNPQKVSAITGPVQIIEDSERAYIMLPDGTHLFIKDALFLSSSQRNLISFKDINEWEPHGDCK